MRLSKAKLYASFFVFWARQENGRFETFLGLADFDHILASALRDIQLCISPPGSEIAQRP
jgi:hypothetical protein